MLVRLLDRWFYQTYTDRWDDKALREVIINRISSSSQVLDLGAGAGIVPEMNFRGLAKRVVGVDPDPRVTSNCFLDEAVVALAENMPFQENTFDVVFSDNVLEHVEQPERFMRSVARILKPGGVFVAKTPNRLHYVSVLSRMTPLWFHKFYNGLRGRKHDDTFPTFYRLNSYRDLSVAASRSGFDIDSIKFIEGRPEYLRLLALFYLLGTLYERFVNAIDFMSKYRCVIIVVLRKKHATI